MPYSKKIIIMLFVIIILLILLCFQFHSKNKVSYTIINNDTTSIINKANQKIDDFYNTKQSSNIVDNTVNFFLNQKIPYGYAGAMGEGSCEDNKKCLHIQQDPIYRLDMLNCFTLVQNFLALIQSKNLKEFQTTIKNIAYGTYSKYTNNVPLNNVSYINRNNFVSSDFNKINQESKRIIDVTNSGIFKDKKLTKSITGIINHKDWFALQASDSSIKQNIRILEKNKKYANQVVEIFKNNYANKFPKIRISLDYIPKETLVIKQGDNYTPNNTILNQIPTPSIVSFVRDDSKWIINNQPINKIIGSDILVSHVAILFKKTFKKNEIIYQKISCNYNDNKSKICTVTPVICNKEKCERLMMLAATDAYPKGYVYSYNKTNNSFACTSKNNIPNDYLPVNNCNRVLTMPIGDYFVSKNYGKYNYMINTSLLGINIQKINLN